MPTHEYLVSTDKLATGKNISFSPGNYLSAFVEAQVGQGRYGSVSDVVRAGLRLLEGEETELAALRAALIEGEQNGSCIPFYFETFAAGKLPPVAAGLKSHLALSPRAQRAVDAIWD